jgi:hypothetical protein
MDEGRSGNWCPVILKCDVRRVLRSRPGEAGFGAAGPSMVREHTRTGTFPLGRSGSAAANRSGLFTSRLASTRPGAGRLEQARPGWERGQPQSGLQRMTSPPERILGPPKAGQAAHPN